MFEAAVLHPPPLTFAVATVPEGDPDRWFRAFLEAHGVRLHAFVRRRVHNEADAADIVQQTLLTAFVALPSFRGESLVSTWVFGIARHTVMAHFRNQPRVMWSGDEDPAWLALEGPDDPFQNVVQLQRMAMVRSLLPRFPSGLRDAWRGVVEHGGAYAHVAARLDVPVGTVRSRVSRVRAALRQTLEQAEHGSTGR